jgi:hypothetical protein
MRTLLARWITVNLLVHVGIVAALGASEWSTLVPALLWTPVFGFALYHPWLLQPLSRRPRRLRIFLGCCLAWLLLSAAYRVHLGGYPDLGALEFLLTRPDYALVLVRDRTGLWLLPAALLAAAGVVWVARGEPGAPWPRMWKGAGLVLTIALLLGFQRVDASPRGMGPDVMALRILMEFSPRRVRAGGFPRALALERPAAPLGPPPPFDILLLVNESLSADGLDPRFRPALRARQERGELLVFPRAFSAASMTDLALPSLFSGLTPAQPLAEFHRVPLPWHRARAHGMRTAFFSVQKVEDGDLADFLLTDGLDEWKGAERAGLSLANDLGGEDGALLPWYRAWLRRERGRPTFTVLHFNATHAPGLEMPECAPWSARDVERMRPGVLPTRRAALARYWNAIAYLDQVQEEVLRILEEEGRLDTTWILSTSDHGECFEGPARARLDDLRPATLAVPFWMHLPRAFPPAFRDAVQANRLRLVSNLDVVPTLAEALGDPPPALPGASLLEPLDPGPRHVVAHDSGEIRLRQPETAALIWEEGPSLATWRWHGEDGVRFEVMDGPEWHPFHPFQAQRAQVRQVLGAYPILMRAGARAE